MYRVCLFVSLFLATFSLSGTAMAYLDPGTGSMLLQLLLGGVAGALVVGKLYWQRLKDLITGSRRAPTVRQEPGEEIHHSGRGSH